MSSPLPNDLSLTVINDGAQIVASDHRNNYAAVQAAVNALRDALAGGTVGQVVSVVDSTHIQLGLLTNSNVDAAAAIAYSKLNLASSIVTGDIVNGTILNADINASAAIALSKLATPFAAVANATPADPGGTTANAPRMAGLSSGTTFITPNSTRLFIQITGTVANTGSGVTSYVGLRYGTGNGPANTAAATGTVIGVNVGAYHAAANANVPFSVAGVVTGLTPATPLWVDLTEMSDGSHTVTLTGITMLAYDIT